MTLTVTQGDQDIANNTTTVQYSLVLHRKYKIVSGTVKKAYSITINGTTCSGNIAVDGSGDLTIKTGSLKVTHASDGKKIISFSASISLDITWEGTKINTISGSSSMKLTDIPRASSFGTVSGDTIDNAITVNVTRYSSSFTHKIAYKIGTGSWSEDTASFGTSVSITPPLSACSDLPNSTSGTMQIRLQTYNGSTKIGSLVYKNITIKVPSGVVPIIDKISVFEASEANVGDRATTLIFDEGFIKNISKLKVVVDATPKYSSKIKSYSTSISNVNYSGSEFTSKTINTSGSVTIKTTVIDSRGRSATKSVTINVLDYSNPKIALFKMQRCDKSGTLDENGEYGKFTFSYKISPLNNKNQKRVQILAYKNLTWTNIYNDENSLDYTVDNMTFVDSITTFSVNTSHLVKLVLSDSFSKNIEVLYAVDPSFTLLNYGSSGRGLGIGMPSSENALQVNLPSEFHKNVYVPQSNGELYKLPKIACGKEVISINNANTPTKVSITFPQGLFDSAPVVTVSPSSTVPGTTVLGVGAYNVTSTGCDIYVTRSNTTDTGVYWQAIEYYDKFSGHNDTLGLQVDFENKQFTRLAAAVGKKAGTDFDSFNMYGGMRRCNVDDNGRIVAYYSDKDFVDTDNNIQVMVYVPKFYYKVEPLKMDKNASGLGYHIRKANYYICDLPKAGFKLHPAFRDENGNEIDYFLYSAYEGALYRTSANPLTVYNDAVHTSKTLYDNDLILSRYNTKPISGQNLAITRTLAEKYCSNRGAGWHSETIQAVSALKLLMMIEYGSMNIQNDLGDMYYPKSEQDGINYCAITGSTRSLGNNSGKAATTYFQHYDKEQEKTVTEQYSGDRKVSCSYRGIENPYGNLWRYVQGVNVWGDGTMAGGQPYIAENFNYNELSHSNNYKSAGFTIANENGYINAMGYGSEDFDWLLMPSEVGGTSALPVGDYVYTSSNVNGHRIVRHGGAWNYGLISGMFAVTSNTLYTSYGVINGCRLIYLPQN